MSQPLPHMPTPAQLAKVRAQIRHIGTQEELYFLLRDVKEGKIHLAAAVLSIEEWAIDHSRRTLATYEQVKAKNANSEVIANGGGGPAIVGPTPGFPRLVKGSGDE